MNIRQAAQWARGKGLLHFYAVYDTQNNIVECIGTYEKCIAYRHNLESDHICMPTIDGRWLRMEELDQVWEQICESDAEAGVIPEQSYIREWT